MEHEFDPGYPRRFASLLRAYPGVETYPPDDFRVEWGPIFHRGRLDGTARVVIIGQDPAAHESVARRILVGEAGQRVQGLLAKLGIDRSYVMINTFLYSVFGQGGGARHEFDESIAAYRNRWIDKVVTDRVEAVIALGGLAHSAFDQWKATPAGQASGVAFAPITHPTFPESASASGKTTKKDATKAMLANWNTQLPALRAAVTPDVEPAPPLVTYGEAFAPEELVRIPERDLPPGLPDWMGSLDAWASRQPIGEAQGPTATPDAVKEAKRAGLGVKVPRRQRIWHTSP
jgi:uracil-DNA glycosylase